MWRLNRFFNGRSFRTTNKTGMEDCIMVSTVFSTAGPFGLSDYDAECVALSGLNRFFNGRSFRTYNYVNDDWQKESQPFFQRQVLSDTFANLSIVHRLVSTVFSTAGPFGPDFKDSLVMERGLNRFFNGRSFRTLHKIRTAGPIGSQPFFQRQVLSDTEYITYMINRYLQVQFDC